MLQRQLRQPRSLLRGNHPLRDRELLRECVSCFRSNLLSRRFELQSAERRLLQEWRVRAGGQLPVGQRHMRSRHHRLSWRLLQYDNAGLLPGRVCPQREYLLQ